MNPLMECDWACLAGVERGDDPASAGSAESRARLEAMNFIAARPRNTLVITGLGRDALIRHHYRLAPAVEKRPHAATAARSDQAAAPGHGTFQPA